METEHLAIHFEFSDYLYVSGKCWTKKQIARELDIIQGIVSFDKLGNDYWVPSELEIEFFSKYRIPEAWHRWVLGMNWDNGDTEEHIEWIVRQPECDIGTAVHVLQSCFYLVERESPPVFSELGVLIIERAAAGEYKRYKCPPKTMYPKVYDDLKLELSSGSQRIDGINFLLNSKIEDTIYDVPCSSDEIGVGLIGRSEDYRGLYEQQEFASKNLANPASALVFD